MCGFHGDDFYTEGEPEVLDQVDAMIPTRFKAKNFFTSRPARFKETSYLLQSHGKHFEALAELLSLTVVKPAPTRVTTETGKGARDTLDVLAKAEAATCRRGTSIAMYIAPHRDDDQFTVKGLASDMKNPTRTQARRGGRRWLESQRGDLQFDAVRSNTDRRAHDRDLEREPEGHLTVLDKE